MDLTNFTIFVMLATLLCSNARRRAKRDLLDFCKMIKCATGRDCFDYNNYGCWCGLGGRDSPVDHIDECCQMHDICYEHLRVNKNCSPKLDGYEWRCNNTLRYAMCAITGRDSWCELQICECDRRAVQCFARFAHPGKKPDCPNSNFFQSAFRTLTG